LLDYFFPTLGLAVELDSEYHNGGKDELRDKYLMSIGIKTFRMSHLERTDIQKTKFKELCKEMRGMTPREAPMVFSFTDNIRRREGL
jgi:very-short-patch-repair endonuclease